MNKTYLISIAIAFTLATGSAFASGPSTKVGGKVDTKVHVKTIVQAGIGKDVKQRLAVGSVECAEVSGDFKSNVKADQIIQAGIGKGVGQSMSIGSVVGSGCTP